MESEDGLVKTLVKCFVHGIAFSLLFLMLVFAWFFGLVFLMAGLAFVGLLIGIAVLLPCVGALNRFLTDVIWRVETGSTLRSLFPHGLVLLVLILAANIATAIGVGLVLPGTISIIVYSVVLAFVDGYIAKAVATLFPDEPQERARPYYSSKQEYLKSRYQEGFKCGGCFWFGKPGCKRGEEHLNAMPCENFMARYSD